MLNCPASYLAYLGGEHQGHRIPTLKQALFLDIQSCDMWSKFWQSWTPVLHIFPNKVVPVMLKNVNQYFLQNNQDSWILWKPCFFMLSAYNKSCLPVMTMYYTNSRGWIKDGILLFFKKSISAINIKSFDSFYGVWKNELFAFILIKKFCNENVRSVK